MQHFGLLSSCFNLLVPTTVSASPFMMELHPGMDVHLACISTGVPDPMFSWSKNDVILVNGSEGVFISSDGNRSEIMIVDMRGQIGGRYNCTGFNWVGQATVTYIVECTILFDQCYVFFHTGHFNIFRLSRSSSGTLSGYNYH